MARDPEDVKDLASAVGLKVWPSFIERACDTRAEKFYNGGWRGSKTVSADFDALCFIVPDLITKPGTHLGWLIGPDYEQARPDYENLEEWCRTKLGMTVTSSDAGQGPLTMTIQDPDLPGVIEVNTKSASHPQTLGSVGPRFILACEAGQMSEQARDRIRGRASTHNAPILWNGTFENDDGKAQFSWFEEESKRYKDFPTPRRKSYSLPIWENMGLFADCREMIAEDPSLAAFCPDDNHGPAHSGIDPQHPALIESTGGVPLHPKLRELYEECRDKPTYWRKYYAGEPVGVLNPVYEWASVNPDHYLRKMPAELHSPNYQWARCSLGADFGTVHPSAVVLLGMDQSGKTWARLAEKDTSGAMDWPWVTMQQWARRYHVPDSMIGRDPMVRLAPTFLEGEAMSGSLYARESRVGWVNTLVRDDCLFFNSDDPGCVLLFREIQLVHRRRMANGQIGYDRTEGEDMAAAFENAVAKMHGQPFVTLPKSMSLRRPKPQRRYAPATARRGL